MKKCPEALEFAADSVMSNFDHEIDRATEQLLRKGGHRADYPARNFYGVVWFEDGQFKCEVMRYERHVATIEAETLEEIMREASERWGYD